MRLAQAPPTKSANAVYVTLAAQVASLGALVVFEQVRGRHLAAEVAAVGGRPSGADADALAGAATAFAVLLLLVVTATVAAAIAYLTWLVRARQAVAPSYARSTVAAAWFVPGVNLIAPAVLVYETWQAAGPPEEGRRGRVALVASWWLSWLATLAVFTLVLPFDADGLTGLGVPELACLALTAALCAATVHQITALQRSPAVGRAASPAPVTTHLDPAT
ncbi:DUF4328 domain-containing protein [Nonomuraea sp. MCN248]|uniref:DUF4328 domain-containing protein n=1 Tax=Nonomuraea corallina TaxID=2989783 RepID=A0ABT4SM30_9ACTN|nr:DUF4328 domain-containing protein [Nonomuraea corallina]MDA0638301.1 DUF4328 domain-containing protein [Nonomuraea corallina]